jgi:hypothetical protein
VGGKISNIPVRFHAMGYNNVYTKFLHYQGFAVPMPANIESNAFFGLKVPPFFQNNSRPLRNSTQRYSINALRDLMRDSWGNSCNLIYYVCIIVNALIIVTLSLRPTAKQSHKNWIASLLRSSQ